MSTITIRDILIKLRFFLIHLSISIIIIRFFLLRNLLPEFLQPQHIWPYIQQNFIHHHSQIHSQGFHVSLVKRCFVGFLSSSL